jgi:phosphoglycerate dehydrogenase-like enzyme
MPIPVLYFVRAEARLYELIRSVAPAAYEMLFLESDDPAERAEKLARAEVIMVGGARLGEDAIAAAPNLRVVLHQGVGYHDTVATTSLRDRQIPLAITPGGTSEGVAEHTLMMMLAVGRRLPALDRSVREGEWLSSTYRAEARGLKGATVGIIGLGRIGREVARRLAPFEPAEILYHDIADIPPEVERALGVRRVEREALLAAGDIVTLHVPLTEQTHHMIDGDALAAMKDGAMLINCARGPVVSEPDLIAALRSGKLSGAGLDVFEVEPIAGPSPFAAFHNVVLTPHNAPGTRDVMHGKFRDMFDNADRFFRGEHLIEKVDL